MKKIFLAFCLLLTTSVCLFAQGQPARGREGRGGIPSFEQFMAEKTNFMVKEMKLNAADSTRFVSIYMQLQQEKGKLMQKYRNGREVFQKMRQGEELEDSLYMRIVINDAQIQLEDAKLEREYIDKFAKVLTPKQVFSLMLAERKFKNTFMQRRPREGRRN